MLCNILHIQDEAQVILLAAILSLRSFDHALAVPFTEATMCSNAWNWALAATCKLLLMPAVRKHPCCWSLIMILRIPLFVPTLVEDCTCKPLKRWMIGALWIAGHLINKHASGCASIQSKGISRRLWQPGAGPKAFTTLTIVWHSTRSPLLLWSALHWCL